jgi:hypothetical protein
MVDKVVHEFFGRDIEDFQARVVVKGEMADGVHEMGLAQAGSAVDIERVVGFSRFFGDGHRGGMGKLVAGADDEIFEGVIGVQVGVEKHPILGAALVRRAPHERKRGIVKDVFNVINLSEQLLGGLVEQAGIMEGKPVLEIRIRHLDVKAALFLADVGGGLKPGLVTVLVDLFLKVLDDLNPRICLFFHLRAAELFFHRNFHICGKFALPAEAGEKGCLIIALSNTDFKSFYDKNKKFLIGAAIGFLFAGTASGGP